MNGFVEWMRRGWTMEWKSGWIEEWIVAVREGYGGQEYVGWIVDVK